MSFPTTSLLDAFSGTLASWSANVEAGYPTMTIASGRLGPRAGFQSNYWSTIFGEDQEAWVTVPVLPAASSIRLIIRLQNPGAGHKYYHVTVDSGGGMYLDYTTAGSPTNLQVIGGSGVIAAGNKIGVSAIGTTLQTYKDVGAGWVTAAAPVTNTSIAGSGHVGLQAYNDATAVARFDDFGGGAVVVASTGLTLAAASKGSVSLATAAAGSLTLVTS